MNKKEFIKALSDDLQVSNKNANIIYNTFINVIKKGLIEDGEVNLVGLIKFNKVHKPSKIKKNSLTGQMITVSDRDVIKTKISQTFLINELNYIGGRLK